MTFKKDIDEWRAFLGRYGVSGRMQTTKIGELSEGQKSRICIAMMCLATPNMVRAPTPPPPPPFSAPAAHSQH